MNRPNSSMMIASVRGLARAVCEGICCSSAYNHQSGLVFPFRPSARVIVRSLLSLNLHHDQDVVTARQRAAQIARLLEFDASEQTRLATAVSEIVRNAFRYAGGGVVHFDFDPDARPQRLIVRVEDHGGGIADLD